jgi:hypothetical protein
MRKCEEEARIECKVICFNIYCLERLIMNEWVRTWGEAGEACLKALSWHEIVS